MPISGGGGGSTTFIGLSDTPASFSGEGSKYAVVNGAENAIEFSATTVGTHSMTSSQHTGDANSVYYGDSSADVKAVSLGNQYQVLRSDGASAAPVFGAYIDQNLRQTDSVTFATASTNIEATTIEVSGNITDGGGNTESMANVSAAYAHVSNDGTDHSYIDQDVTSGADVTFGTVSAQLEATTIELAGNLTDGGGNTLSVANAAAAYTHVSNNGTDHSYIDQDVTSGADVTFGTVSANLAATTIEVSGNITDGGGNTASVAQIVTAGSTDTFTNKTFDANGTGNSLSNVDIADISAGSKSGADSTLITGTKGTNGNLAEWNADGDAVDSSLATADVVTGSSTDTFTNKTFDANGTGNSISNIEAADFAAGSTAPFWYADGTLSTYSTATQFNTLDAGTIFEEGAALKIWNGGGPFYGMVTDVTGDTVSILATSDLSDTSLTISICGQVVPCIGYSDELSLVADSTNPMGSRLMECECTLLGTYVYVLTAPTGSGNATQFDVHKNGTSVHTAKIGVNDSANASSYTRCTASTTAAKGDRFEFFCDAVGETTSGGRPLINHYYVPNTWSNAT